MFHMTQRSLLLALISLSCASACRDPLPCPECEEADIEDSPDDSDLPPDLPCGGADLMTDNDNCGGCGNACNVWYEGTDVEAGTCVDGECGPYWTQCNDYSDSSCAEVCAGYSRTCVAEGCSGLTAALYYVGLEGACQTESPALTMTGSCDEPIPYESTIEGTVHAMCCCE